MFVSGAMRRWCHVSHFDRLSCSDDIELVNGHIRRKDGFHKTLVPVKLSVSAQEFVPASTANPDAAPETRDGLQRNDSGEWVHVAKPTEVGGMLRNGGLQVGSLVWPRSKQLWMLASRLPRPSLRSWTSCLRTTQRRRTRHHSSKLVTIAFLAGDCISLGVGAAMPVGKVARKTLMTRALTG